MEKCEREKYMDQDGCFVWLIPTNWFKKWKKHTFFYELTGESEHKKSRDTMQLENNKNEDNASENEDDFFPGKIHA